MDDCIFHQQFIVNISEFFKTTSKICKLIFGILCYIVRTIYFADALLLQIQEGTGENMAKFISSQPYYYNTALPLARLFFSEMNWGTPPLYLTPPCLAELQENGAFQNDLADSVTEKEIMVCPHVRY